MAGSVGFIGLGLMGEGFTHRLIEKGYAVTGYDLDRDKRARAAAQGVVEAGSPAEVAAASEIVLMCVTSTDAVRAVVFGSGGLSEAAGANSIIVDHSTTIVDDTKTMAADLKERTGAAWVDAPVSGGPAAAKGGSLAIMAGGDEAAIARVSPLMTDLSGVFTHMGPVGAGQVTKMVNQVLVLNNYVILAEALAMAEAGGIDAAKIPAALATGHAGSNLLNALFPRLIERDYEPQGYVRQILKDLHMLDDLARSLKVPTPMSSQATNLFRVLSSKGHNERDGIAVMKLYDPKDGV